MRPTDANVVALLASTRQIVFWEEFTFTLANGDEVMYTTKDPDFTLPVVLPPPPGPSLWLLDTFTGPAAETLAVHVGEIGATWSNGTFGYPAGAADFVLDGTGNVAVAGGDAGQVLASGVPPDDTSDFYVEASIFVGDFGVFALYAMTLPDFLGISMACSDIGVTNLAMDATASNASENFDDFGLDTGIPHVDGVSVVVWMEVTVGRTVISYGVGSARGVNQVAQYTLSSPLIPGINAVQMVANPSIVISSISGGPL